MSAKTPPEVIERIRDMRRRGYSQMFIRNALNVSTYVVSVNTQDIKVNLISSKALVDKPKSTIPCVTYPFSELSPEDQEKYSKCQPAVKDIDKKVFVWAKKGDYSEAAVFMDYRRAHGL